jgi:hypothetical protein
MKDNSNNNIIGLAFFGVVSCGVLWKLYHNTSHPNRQQDEGLSARFLLVERELEETKQRLATIEKLVTEKKTYGTQVLASDAKLSVPVANNVNLSQVISQVFNDITVVHHTASDATQKEMAQFAQKIVKALDVFAKELRQEFQHELRSKLERTVDLHYKQKLVLFEILVGYVLDTNLQQCYDFAALKTLIENSGQVEKDRIYSELKVKALEAVEKILYDAAPSLERPVDNTLIDSGYGASSSSTRIIDSSDLSGLMGMVEHDASNA